MIDYYNVIPHKTKLLQKHFGKGRGGKKPQYITRHHLAGIGTTEDVWQWWQTRQASAHYVVERDGTVGQLVYDNDTAWSNANSASNQVSLSIEHGNSGGAAADWPISEATIIGGARLAAALCRFYDLGRPVFGKNIRDHREFGSTSCPHHLATGGKYHQHWMNEAQRFYDLLDKRLVTPLGTPIMPNENTSSSAPKEEKFSMSAVQEIKDYLDARVTGPIGSDVKDVRQQLTGGRDAGQYPGYEQIDNRTVVDALAVIGEKLGIPGFHDPHEGSLKAKREANDE